MMIHSAFPHDAFGDPRDYAAEAREMLAGTLPLSPSLAHCQALLLEIWMRTES